MNSLVTAPVVACYIVFLVLSLTAIASTALILYRGGLTVLLRTDATNESFATATIRLITAAFLLINLGFVSYLVLPRLPLNTPDQILQFETDKCGAVLIALGLSSFVALFSMARMRKTSPQPARDGVS